MTGTYDPELNTALLGHRQSESRLLRRSIARATTSTPIRCSRSTPDTGTLKWHYQFTPHDVHDWDSNHVPVLADWGDRKVVMVANRNGFFYVLDRRTGELILGKPFTDTTWAREIGKDGRPDHPQRRQQGMPARHVGRHELQSADVTIPR